MLNGLMVDLGSNMSRGGVRPGAGRKSKGQTEAFGCRMKVENKEYLKKLAAERGITATEVLETIIERYKESK